MSIDYGINCYSQRIAEQQKEITCMIEMPQLQVLAAHSDGTLTLWKKKVHVIDHHFGFQKLSTIVAHEKSIVQVQLLKIHVETGNHVVPLEVIITTTKEDTILWSLDLQKIHRVPYSIGRFLVWKEKLVCLHNDPKGKRIDIRKLRVSESSQIIQMRNADCTEQLIQMIVSRKLSVQLEVVQSLSFAENQGAQITDLLISNDILLISSYLDPNTSNMAWLVNYVQLYHLSDLRPAFERPHDQRAEEFPTLLPFQLLCSPVKISPEDETRKFYTDLEWSLSKFLWPIPQTHLNEIDSDMACCGTLWHGTAATIFPNTRQLKVWNSSGNAIISIPLKDQAAKYKLYAMHGILWGIATTKGASSITCWKSI